LANRIYVPPEKSTRRKHLCADAGYTGKQARTIIISYGYIPHVRSRGEEISINKRHPDYKPRRWIVEVSHSWFNRFRKLAIRYEKTDASFLALHHLAASIIALRKVGFIYG
jgi:transposase